MGLAAVEGALCLLLAGGGGRWWVGRGDWPPEAQPCQWLWLMGVNVDVGAALAVRVLHACVRW